MNPEGPLPEMNQGNPNLAAVVGVNRSRRVGHRHAVPNRQSRAGTNLPLVASRDLHLEPGANEVDGTGLKIEIGLG
jgi:hypothetical protein